MIPGETIRGGAPSHEKDPNISEFKVMRSAAGWYIGTTYKEDFGEVPNSRETDYFGSEEEAQNALDIYKKTGRLLKERF